MLMYCTITIKQLDGTSKMGAIVGRRISSEFNTERHNEC